MKRLIIVAAVLALVVVLVGKKRSAGPSEWHGMTEEQARERLGERLPNQMPDAAKAAVTDKIVGQMKDKGVIIDLTDEAQTNGSEPAEDVTTAPG